MKKKKKKVKKHSQPNAGMSGTFIFHGADGPGF